MPNEIHHNLETDSLNYLYMKKAFGLLNGYVQKGGPLHFYQRMQEELLKFGIDLEMKTNQDILSWINAKGSIQTKELTPYSFCLYLDKDGYISKMLELAGLRLFNSSESIYLCDDKMLTHIALANHGISMPKTISAPLNYVSSFDEQFLFEVEKELSFPLIGKRNFGSLGKGVFLLKNHDEVVSFEKEYQAEPHLYQEFISSSFGFDYRLILIGGKFVAGMRRHNENGDFRSNIAQGGKGEKMEIPLPYIRLAEKAAQILKLDYCGVDLLKGKNGESILCEVNSNAFLKGIEEVTGINIAYLYAKYIVDSL